MAEDQELKYVVSADATQLTNEMKKAAQTTEAAAAKIAGSTNAAATAVQGSAQKIAKNINTAFRELKDSGTSGTALKSTIEQMRQMGEVSGRLSTQNAAYFRSLAEGAKASALAYGSALQDIRAQVEQTGKVLSDSQIDKLARLRAQTAGRTSILGNSFQDATFQSSKNATSSEFLNSQNASVRRAYLGQQIANNLADAAPAANEVTNSLKRVEQTAGEAGHDAITSLDAVRGVSMAADGNILHSRRVLENFISRFPVAVNAAKLLYPALGVAAIAGALAQIGTEAYDAIMQAKKAAQATQDAFGSLNLSLSTTNDELSLTNAKLENATDKLEKKPINSLAEALAQSRVQADELANSLERAYENQKSLLAASENNVSGGMAILLTKGSTADTAGTINAYDRQLATLGQQYSNAMDTGDTKGAAGIRKQIDDKIASARQHYKSEMSTLEYAQKNGFFGSTFFGLGKEHEDETDNIGMFQGGLQTLDNVQAGLSLRDQNAKDEKSNDAAQQAAQKREEAKAAAEQAKQAMQQRLQDMETQWADLQAQGNLGADAEYGFWSKRTDAFKKGSSEYLSVIRNANRAYTEVQRSNNESLSEASKLPGALAPNVQGFFGPATVQRPAMTVPDALKEDGSLEAIKQNSAASMQFLQTLSSFSGQSQKQTIAMRQAQLEISKATGDITSYQAAVAQAAIHNDDFAASTQRIQAALAAVDANSAGLSINEQAAARAKLQSQLNDVNNAAAVQSMQDQAAEAAATFSGQLRTSLNQWVNETQDAARQVAAVVTGTLDSVNGTFAEALTGKYRTGHERSDALRNGLSNDLRGASTSLTKNAIGGLEGSALKALGLGKKSKADGSQSNPYFVRIAGTAQGSSSGSQGGNPLEKAASGFIRKIFSPKTSPAIPTLDTTGGADPLGLNTPASATDATATSASLGSDGGVAASLFGGISDGLNKASDALFASALSGPAKAVGSLFQGHFADGGDVVANRPAIIGERGPEMFIPKGAGRIIPNDKAFGGNHVHFSPTIDARGSTNPAETQSMINRSLRQALPQFSAAANQARTSANKRVPSSKRV